MKYSGIRFEAACESFILKVQIYCKITFKKYLKINPPKRTIFILDDIEIK